MATARALDPVTVAVRKCEILAMEFCGVTAMRTGLEFHAPPGLSGSRDTFSRATALVYSFIGFIGPCPASGVEEHLLRSGIRARMRLVATLSAKALDRACH